MTSYAHANTSAQLSSGRITTLTTNSNDGFILAGYVPSLLSAGANIFVDKTNDAGLIAGPWSFQRNYALSNGGTNCNAQLLPELDCFGVSIIETNVLSLPPAIPSTIWYAMTSCFANGVLFAGLNSSGGISTSNFYSLPNGATHPTKALIAESLINKNTYYICGSYYNNFRQYLYAMRVDAQGNVIWGQEYDLGASTDINPKAIVEAPSAFSGGQPVLVVVGIVDSNQGLGDDAFYMTIDDGSMGAIVTFDVFYAPGSNSNEEFHSIDIASHGGGYIVGGYSDGNLVGGRAWMVLIDPSNPTVPIWNTVAEPHSDFRAGAVVGVFERYSNAYNSEEYYGTLASVDGIMVIKLDANGLPFSQPGNLSNEFTYQGVTGNVVTTPMSITYSDVNGSNRQGFQIFGNDFPIGPSTTEYYMTRACFNGVAGTVLCNQNYTVIANSSSGPSSTYNLIPNANQGLHQCNSYVLTTLQINSSVTQACSATSIPAAGNNNKPSSMEQINSILELDADAQFVQLIPNPSFGDVTLKVGINSTDDFEIEIYDYQGNIVKFVDKMTIETNNGIIKLTSENFSVRTGIYLVRLTVGKKSYNHKLIYFEN